MVLVVIFPLPDEKSVDVKTIFTCSQTCLLEMNLRVLTLPPTALHGRTPPHSAPCTLGSHLPSTAVA